MVAAAVSATLASLGYLMDVPDSMVLYSVSWVLLIPRGELTRPIPRSEWWQMLVIMAGGFLAVFLALPFLHLHSPSAPSKSVRFAVAVSLWLLWMWAIYRRWQGKADAKQD